MQSRVQQREGDQNFARALKRGAPHAERIRRLYNERASPKIEGPVG